MVEKKTKKKKHKLNTLKEGMKSLLTIVNHKSNEDP